MSSIYYIQVVFWLLNKSIYGIHLTMLLPSWGVFKGSALRGIARALRVQSLGFGVREESVTQCLWNVWSY
jgi:hypothetical protein